MPPKKITNEKEAIKSLEKYDGLYRNLAIATFMLARQELSIADSINAANSKVFETSNKIMEACERRNNELSKNHP